MKHEAVVVAARATPILFPPRKSAIAWRLRITQWQTDSWTKKIIQLREHSDTREEPQTIRQRGKQPSKR